MHDGAVQDGTWMLVTNITELIDCSRDSIFERGVSMWSGGVSREESSCKETILDDSSLRVLTTKEFLIAVKEL